MPDRKREVISVLRSRRVELRGVGSAAGFGVVEEFAQAPEEEAGANEGKSAADEEDAVGWHREPFAAAEENECRADGTEHEGEGVGGAEEAAAFVDGGKVLEKGLQGHDVEAGKEACATEEAGNAPEAFGIPSEEEEEDRHAHCTDGNEAGLDVFA